MKVKILTLLILLMTLSCMMPNPNHEFNIEWNPQHGRLFINNQEIHGGYFYQEYGQPTNLTLEIIPYREKGWEFSTYIFQNGLSFISHNERVFTFPVNSTYMNCTVEMKTFSIPQIHFTQESLDYLVTYPFENSSDRVFSYSLTSRETTELNKKSPSRFFQEGADFYYLGSDNISHKIHTDNKLPSLFYQSSTEAYLTDRFPERIIRLDSKGNRSEAFLSGELRALTTQENIHSAFIAIANQDNSWSLWSWDFQSNDLTELLTGSGWIENIGYQSGKVYITLFDSVSAPDSNENVSEYRHYEYVVSDGSFNLLEVWTDTTLTALYYKDYYVVDRVVSIYPHPTKTNLQVRDYNHNILREMDFDRYIDFKGYDILTGDIYEHYSGNIKVFRASGFPEEISSWDIIK